MATHSRILAWEVPWAEGTGGLQSLGLQTVRHDWTRNIGICYLEKHRVFSAWLGLSEASPYFAQKGIIITPGCWGMQSGFPGLTCQLYLEDHLCRWKANPGVLSRLSKAKHLVRAFTHLPTCPSFPLTLIIFFPSLFPNMAAASHCAISVPGMYLVPSRHAVIVNYTLDFTKT